MSTSQAYIDAHDEGYGARHEGKKRSENPYSLLGAKDEHTGWDDGWEEANDEILDDNEDE